MIKSIKNIMVIVLTVTTFTSCNQGPTLQTYFVDNELKSGFVSADVPVDVLALDKVELTKQQQKAYESVDKLNVLAFTLDENNKDEYKSELDKVNVILKNSKYQELARGGNNTDGRFSVKFIGEIDHIDELIIFGNANDRGFVVVRVLGDGMNAGELMSLQSVLKDINFDDGNLNVFKDFFK